MSDRNVGELGHPVQFDSTNTGWYVTTNGSQIFTAVNALSGERTEPTFVKRINDARKIDDKIYKLRVVIPKELKNSKNVENGFILQESSTTGVGTDAEFNKKNEGDLLTKDDYNFERNPRFISKATYSAPDATLSLIHI